MRTNTYRKRKTGAPINKTQIGIIKMACSHLQIDDATYRDMLQDRYSVTSCTKLSYDQAGEFIRELESKGFVLKSKSNPPYPPSKKGGLKFPFVKGDLEGFDLRPRIPRSSGNVIALASQDERDKINAVAELIQWREANGLALFLEKRMGIKDGSVRTSAEACLAIEGLKKMFQNGMKKQHGPAWWRMAFTDPRIMEYIKQHCPEEWR